MKSPSRFKLSAALTLGALATLVIASACGDDTTKPEPTPEVPAPTNVTATVVSQTQIDVTWQDNSQNEAGFKIESCSGAACANFTEVGTVAANVTTFSHIGLTANTDYSYRIRAHAEQGMSAYSNTSSAKTPEEPPIAQAVPVLVGAGEITTCLSSVGPMGTARIVDSLLADTNVTAFTVGNNLADEVAGSTYENCFADKWGQFKDRTYFAIGNDDFKGGRGANGVYSYLGDRTGPRDKGWFSFDRGNWHVVVLNTSDWQWGSEASYGITSEQLRWLTEDLAATTKPCILAISWQRRLYTTGAGELGRRGDMTRVSSALYAAGVDVLVSAYDKLYARFAPANPSDGTPDPTRGLRQFLVGSGGRSHDQAVTAGPALREAQIGNTWGVLKLSLGPSSYSWQFITTTGQVADEGTTNCH